MGAISYFDATNTALKIAICADTASTTATLATVDGTNDTGHFSSIVSASNSQILISYSDNTLKDLKLALCNLPTTCNAPTVETVTSAGDVGRWSAMTILGNDDIAIAFSTRPPTCCASPLA